MTFKAARIKIGRYRVALNTACHCRCRSDGDETNTLTSREIVSSFRRESHRPESHLHFSVSLTVGLLCFVAVTRGWKWIPYRRKIYFWMWCSRSRSQLKLCRLPSTIKWLFKNEEFMVSLRLDFSHLLHVTKALYPWLHLSIPIEITVTVTCG